MSKKTADRYEICPLDGMRRELVHSWAAEKHLYLRRYVDIIRETVKKFPRAGADYIDLFSGPGRARVIETDAVIDGSAVLAATEAMKATPFRNVIVGDIERENLDACVARLSSRGVTGVHGLCGPASETAAKAVSLAGKHSLKLALLDPYALGVLPFSLIEVLAGAERMDLLIHFSLMDFNRNVRAMIGRGDLEAVFPRWRESVDEHLRDEVLRIALFQHWKRLLEALGYIVTDNHQRISGARNQPLYLLVLASRHKIAGKFWSEAVKGNLQPDMFG